MRFFPGWERAICHLNRRLRACSRTEPELFLEEKTHLLKYAFQAARRQPRKQIKRRCTCEPISNSPRGGRLHTDRIRGQVSGRSGGCWLSGAEVQPVKEKEAVPVHVGAVGAEACAHRPLGHPPPAVISILISQGSERPRGPRRLAAFPRGITELSPAG